MTEGREHNAAEGCTIVGNLVEHARTSDDEPVTISGYVG
jgi:hypothetical protein